MTVLHQQTEKSGKYSSWSLAVNALPPAGAVFVESTTRGRTMI